MITIRVDEAYAYDMLSVLEIKKDKQTESVEAAQNYQDLDRDIQAQVSNHIEIKASNQYNDLLTVNLSLFNRIDEYKVRGEQLGDATFIDESNYRRFLSKKALQSHFFPSLTLSEQKLGYNSNTISKSNVN